MTTFDEKINKELDKILRCSVDAFLIQTFPSYHTSIPDEFVEDLIEGVKESSDYENGNFNDCDISLEFQRKVLGRMGVCV